MLAAFLLLALCSRCGAAPADPGQVAQRVDRYYNRLHSLQVDFTERYDGLGLHREDAGTLLLKKPGRMRWTYSRPAGKVFVLDGRYGWFYAPGDAQAQRVPAAQLDELHSPLRLLLGHTQLEKELGGMRVIPQGDGYEISGVPRGMEQRVARLALQVTAGGIISSMQLEEVDGSRTSFSFANQRANVPVSDRDFVFHAPAGVPVVDGLPPV